MSKVRFTYQIRHKIIRSKKIGLQMLLTGAGMLAIIFRPRQRTLG